MSDPESADPGGILVWFRRDLRFVDHAALCHALLNSSEFLYVE